MFPPSLQLVFLTGKYIIIVSLSVYLCYPANFLVVSYMFYVSLGLGLNSVSLARPSMNFSLSDFTLFLTVLIASLYYSCAALFRLLFISLPSSLALC